MKLNEILLIGGALVAALVLSKNGKLSSTYSLPEITNPVSNIITQVKSEPVQKTIPLLENILPTPIPVPTPEPIIIPTPEPTPPPNDYSRGHTAFSVNLGRNIYVAPDGSAPFRLDKNRGGEEAKLIAGLSRYARGLPEESV